MEFKVPEVSSLKNAKHAAVVRQTMTNIQSVLIAERHALTRAGIVYGLGETPKYEIVGETADLITTMGLVEQVYPSLLLFEPGVLGPDPVKIAMELTRVSPDTKLVVILDERDRCCELTHGLPVSGGLMKSDGLETLREILEEVCAGGPAFSDAYFAASNSPKPCENLTDRERQIMSAILGGSTSRNIAERLGISVKTVENHRTNLMRKLGVHSVATLSQWARSNACVYGAG
jgi:DNA-binding NarL/FixJ family response regulator